MAAKFDRAISDKFLTQLKAAAATSGWWADVLTDENLIIALRGTYLNVYWRGQALFTVEPGPTDLSVTTHEKYLLDPALKDQVPLEDGVFRIEALANKGFIRSYEGPATLDKMKKAAGLFSGLEKAGCHEIAVGNPAVIDCEIAFPGVVSMEDGGIDKTAPRVDLAVVEVDGENARLVFWEAKHFSNGELRAAGDKPAAVCRQLKVYEKYLASRHDEIAESYARVAANLAAIDMMRPKPRLSPLIAKVGSGECELKLGAEPRVGLIVFGFDAGQKADPAWKKHLDKLKADGLDVRAKGDPKGLVI